MQTAGYGRIVSMSSLNAHSGGVTAAVSKFAYAAAKAGIIGMTRSLAKELGPNIFVNCVCPGLIKTEVAGNAVIREREPELIKGIALKRVGTPRDVAEVVAFWLPRSPALSPARTLPSMACSGTDEDPWHCGNQERRPGLGVDNGYRRFDFLAPFRA